MTIKMCRLSVVCLLVLALVTPALSISDIYQDSIPHLKACISKIREFDQNFPADETVELRQTCPTLAYFLTYEPMSEIDPPLENYTTLAQLQALVELLQSAKTLSTASIEPIKPSDAKQYPEQAEKPLLLALTQWLTSQVHAVSLYVENISGIRVTDPESMHTVYTALANLILISIFVCMYIYFVLYLKKTRLYEKLFYKQASNSTIANDITLDKISDMRIQHQIPALSKHMKNILIKNEIINSDSSNTTSNIIEAIKQNKPEILRDASRLLHLLDKIRYASKPVSANDVHLVFELTRNIQQSLEKQ